MLKNVYKKISKMFTVLKTCLKCYEWMDGQTDRPTSKVARTWPKNREWLITDSAKVLEIKETKPKQKTQAPKRKT